MPLAEEFHTYDKTNTLWDRETWEALFGDAARSSQNLADSVALLLKDILLATTGSRKSIEQLRNTAKDGIEWVWPFTQDYELSFKAFLYSIEGVTIGGHEPIDLLKEAIAIAEAHLADAHLAGNDPDEPKRSESRNTQTKKGGDKSRKGQDAVSRKTARPKARQAKA